MGYTLTEREWIHVAFVWNWEIRTVQCACFTFEHSYQICREHSQGHFLPTFAQNLCDHKYWHVFSLRRSLYPDVMQHTKSAVIFSFSPVEDVLFLHLYLVSVRYMESVPNVLPYVEWSFAETISQHQNPQRLNATWRSYVCPRSHYPERISLQLRLGQEGAFFVLGTWSMKYSADNIHKLFYVRCMVTRK